MTRATRAWNTPATMAALESARAVLAEPTVVLATALLAAHGQIVLQRKQLVRLDHAFGKQLEISDSLSDQLHALEKMPRRPTPP